MNPKQAFLYTAILYGVFSMHGSNTGLRFMGNEQPVIEIVPDKSTGLEKIYVLKNLSGVSAAFDGVNTPENVRWKIFSNLGAGYSIPLSNTHVENGVSIAQFMQGNLGYLIEYNDEKYCFWIVDYDTYIFNVDAIKCSEYKDCESTVINVDGNTFKIPYYSINGVQLSLPRNIRVSYNNLVWNIENNQYEQEEIVKYYDYINNSIALTPPLYCGSKISIRGDMFLDIWNEAKFYESDYIQTHSVTLETRAIQEDMESGVGNLIGYDIEGLGGSAPCTILFESYVSDAVAHVEWQMSNDELFENITYRSYDADFKYTFLTEGITYVRCIASNDDGSCESYGKVFKVEIGDSDLKIPNVFSPDGDGINDEWKVSYRSLLNFKCWIFDRHGHQVFYTEDPALGWDGRCNGKVVKSGVYYYVITATGADGKRYNRNGDINILSSKKYLDR